MKHFIAFITAIFLYQGCLHSQDLLANYPFNGNAEDESRNGNDGTVFGALLISDRCGNPDSAYNFDGVDDFIDVGNKLNFDSEDFTISVWINRSPDVITNSTIVTKGAQNSSSAGYGITASETIVAFNLSHGSGSAGDANFIETSKWIHVVALRKNENKTRELYIDGVLKVSSNLETAFGSTSNDSKFIIGNRDERDWPRIGNIDDLKVYNRALSLAEIVDLYNSDGLENFPIILDATFAIDEFSSISTIVGTVSASDGDGDDLIYSIVYGNDLGAFEIDQFTGDLSVADSEPLNFETNPTFSLEIKVSDGELANIRIITVNLNDIEDFVVGLNSNANEKSIFPNLTKDFLNINRNRFKKVIISEISGKVLIESNSQTLNIQWLDAGVYLITLVGLNNEQVTIRIIKE